MTDEERIGRALDQVRRRWRWRTALEQLVPWAATGVAALAGWWVLWPFVRDNAAAASTGRLAVAALLAAVAAWRWLRWRRARPTRQAVALYVEERAPGLDQTLISSVEAIDQRDSSPALVGRVVAAALRGLEAINGGRDLERPRVRRASLYLGGLVLGTSAALILGPAQWRAATATLVTPWRPVPVAPVMAVAVTPGDAEVPKGGGADVAASLTGFSSDLADLVFRSDTGAEWSRLPMRRDSSGAFGARLFDITAATQYYVESNGIRSPAFTLRPVDLPAVERTAATIQFPGYTALAPETIADAGDLAVLMGSTVSLATSLTRPAKAASLVIEGRPPVAMTRRPDGRWTAAFKVAGDGFWRIDLETDDGRRLTGLQYAIDALPDAPPSVRFTAPGRDTKVSPIEEVAAHAEATDDYGVRRLVLHVAVNGGPDSVVTLADTTGRALKDLAAGHTFFLEEWTLKPGDLVAYYAEATDGAGLTGRSDMYFFEVRPFDKTYREAEQGGGGGAGAVPGGDDSAEGLSERQRLVVVGAFNAVRDSAAQAREFRENVTTLAIGEGRLRQDVQSLSQRLRSRGMLTADSTFRTIAAALDTAATEIGAAEEQLGRTRPREALPPAQRALTQLQRAEAAYRETQVARGGQGGGGGAGRQQNAEELADLFELETDKLKNQYETVRRESAEKNERRLDETLERLRRLAARQQQENERAQRMADALRGRTAPTGGGGGGAGQRDLARETEEAARQLERLARENNDGSLADAARRLQEAAEQMRRAAAANPGQSGAEGGAALERLKSATRQIDRSRRESRQSEIKSLGDRAADLRDRQRDAAEQSDNLPNDPAARSERLKALGARKDALARDVDRLEADAERLAKEAAADQPAAARHLGEAAEGLRTNRVRDKVLFSKQLAERASPEYRKNFEEQLGRNLDDAVDRLRAAGGAVQGSAGDRKAEALDRARGLVRGLESLAERARAARDERGSRNPAPGDDPSAGRNPGAGQNPGAGRQPGAQGSGGQDDKGRPTKEGRGGGGAPAGEPGTPASPDGRLDAETVRQLGREFRARRQAAESLRADLRALGQDTRDLDRLLTRFRTFDGPATFSNPRGVDDLERDLIAGLKELEFALWRRLGEDGSGDRPAAGASAQVPPQYREQVEEYYRSLARRRIKP